MRRRGLMLLLNFAILLAGLASPVAAGPGIARAIFFYDKECPSCQLTLKDVMPSIHARYGDRLQIAYLEIETVRNYSLFLAAGKQYQIPRERLGVPLLIIGERALIGKDEIRDKLPAEIDNCLARGGVDYPSLPGLTPNDLTASPVPEPVQLAETRQGDPVANGIALAVLAGMILAVGYVGVGIVRSMSRSGGLILGADEMGARRAWERWSVPILAMIGLGISGYLTYIKLSSTAAICGPVGNCDAVQQSAYAQIAGVPVALLGFLAYLVILGLWAWAEFGRGDLAVYAPLALFGVALTGTLFSAYLTALEPFVIRAVCMWCLGSAVTITAIMLVAARPILRVPVEEFRHIS